jgi:hypothetical protein
MKESRWKRKAYREKEAITLERRRQGQRPLVRLNEETIGIDKKGRR